MNNTQKPTRGYVVFGNYIVIIENEKYSQPEHVIKILKNQKLNDYGCKDASDFLCRFRTEYVFIECYVAYDFVVSHRNVHHYKLYNNDNITYRITDSNGVLQLPLYNGPVEKFGEVVRDTQLILNSIGKVIRFYYEGGSASGVRLVKLTGVFGKQPNVVLKGQDLNNGDVNRSYRTDKIKGDIEIVS